MDFGGDNVGRVDAATGAVTLYQTPTAKSWPRRTMLDDRDRLWFTEFAANKLAMFDTRSEAFREWDVPTPYTYPYDVFMAVSYTHLDVYKRQSILIAPP